MTDVPELKLEDCINEECPWSGKPVAADSLARYRGGTPWASAIQAAGTSSRKLSTSSMPA